MLGDADPKVQQATKLVRKLLDDAWAGAKAFFCFAGGPGLPLGEEGRAGFDVTPSCEHFFLIGGSALSIVRRQRVATNVWIGAGALVVALATGLSRADSYALVYAGQLLGIGMMFCGFTLSGARPGRQADRPAGAPVLAQ